MVRTDSPLSPDVGRTPAVHPSRFSNTVDGPEGRVLITHNDLRRLGGIETYVQKVTAHLATPAESFVLGTRVDEAGLVSKAPRLLRDYRQFARRLAEGSHALVHINPSMEAKAYLREAAFLSLAHRHGKKVVVFFHGWEQSFAAKLGGPLRILKQLYAKADAFIVLAEDFARQLRDLGFQQPIHREVMIIHDEVLHDFDLEGALRRRREAPTRKVIFFSRLFEAKGIFTAIRATALLRREFPDVELVVAGDGEAMEQSRSLAGSLGLPAEFAGHLRGDELHRLIHSGTLLCFPTTHAEGFPNTIVESMAFGLPVITRPVGGIKDFFEEGRHGYLSEGTDPEAFAELMARLLRNPELEASMSRYNRDHALRHFSASGAARRLADLYDQTASGAVGAEGP